MSNIIIPEQLKAKPIAAIQVSVLSNGGFVVNTSAPIGSAPEFILQLKNLANGIAGFCSEWKAESNDTTQNKKKSKNKNPRRLKRNSFRVAKNRTDTKR